MHLYEYTYISFCFVSINLSGDEKQSLCRKCISLLDQIHEDLVAAVAKAELIPADAPEDEINTFHQELAVLNAKAEDNVDAGKLVRNKLKAFLTSN